MSDILTIFIATIFVNNILLAQFLGNCPYLGCSREKGVAAGMGSAVVFVIVVACPFAVSVPTRMHVPARVLVSKSAARRSRGVTSGS